MDRFADKYHDRVADFAIGHKPHFRKKRGKKGKEKSSSPHGHRRAHSDPQEERHRFAPDEEEEDEDTKNMYAPERKRGSSEWGYDGGRDGRRDDWRDGRREDGRDGRREDGRDDRNAPRDSGYGAVPTGSPRDSGYGAVPPSSAVVPGGVAFGYTGGYQVAVSFPISPNRIASR